MELFNGVGIYEVLEMDKTEMVLVELKKNGYRITSRRKILAEIVMSGKWESAKEIYYLALKKEPHIGIASVYRFLNALEMCGMISHVYRINV